MTTENIYFYPSPPNLLSGSDVDNDEANDDDDEKLLQHCCKKKTLKRKRRIFAYMYFHRHASFLQVAEDEEEKAVS